MKPQILTLLLLGTLTLSFAHLHHQPLFESWKGTHNKFYATPVEEAHRYSTFVSNYDRILNYNKEQTGVTLGLNQFADLSPEEFASVSACISSDDINNVLSLPTRVLSVSDLPSSVNWTAQGAVTSVKNQEQCGGCWAFAATASLEGYNFIENGELIDLSEQQLIDCASNCEGCNGCSTLYNALEYTAEKGIESYESYPFTGGSGQCQYDASKVIVKNDGYQNIETNNVEQLKAAIAQQPVVVGIQANQLVFQFYQGGVISKLCGDQVDHAVTAVGYAEIDGQEAFIVKNSWGPTWGVNGYVYISANAQANGGAGVCGILTAPVVPTTV